MANLKTGASRKQSFVFLKHPFWDSPFCLITDDVMKTQSDSVMKFALWSNITFLAFLSLSQSPIFIDLHFNWLYLIEVQCRVCGIVSSVNREKTWNFKFCKNDIQKNLLPQIDLFFISWWNISRPNLIQA